MNESKFPKKGVVEVITGGMFSGKSTELIRIANKAKEEGLKVILFKHKKDARYNDSDIVTHDKESIKAIAIEEIEEIYEFTAIEANTKDKREVDVICIDEAQFFGDPLVRFCEMNANVGKRIVVAGLDMDFRGEPFAPMHILMAKADKLKKLNATCSKCGAEASRSQRLVCEKSIVLVGGQESYEPRCRNCHQVEE